MSPSYDRIAVAIERVVARLVNDGEATHDYVLPNDHLRQLRADYNPEDGSLYLQLWGFDPTKTDVQEHIRDYPFDGTLAGLAAAFVALRSRELRGLLTNRAG